MILNFVLFRMMPGSPDRILLRNPNVSPAAVTEIKERWGLDKPLIPDQLIAYLQATAAGDFGFSFKFHGQIGHRRPVRPDLADADPVRAGRDPGGHLRTGPGRLYRLETRRPGRLHRQRDQSLILYSMPYFVIGILLLGVFAIGLHWFPTSGMMTIGGSDQSPFDQLLDFLDHLILPLTTVAIGLIGQYSILMRSSVIETLGEDYVTTARGKGLTSGKILRAHALPNALLPAVTLIAINLGYVIGGAITVEVVFNWPGLGTLTVQALEARDYPVLQGIFLLLAVSVVVANFAADLIYGRLDPRVRS